MEIKETEVNEVNVQEEIHDTKKKISSVITLILFTVIILVLAVVYKSKILERFIDLEILGNEEIILEYGENYTEYGYIASAYNKDLTDKVKVATNLDTNIVGEYKIAYSIENKLLNIHKMVIRDVKIVDTQKPELVINSDKEITYKIGNEFEYPTYTATDNYEGDITNNVNVTTDLDLTKKGTYTINYSVKDSSGNETTDSVTVTVKDKKNPYIVVSISNQTLQYYEYDEVVLTSPVVTGINGKTPTGTFKILNKAQNIVLKGADYASFVNYWMAFSGASFGFHDASWRSKFGGTIYKTNGSHGCVNMPYAKVKQLYNMVSVGTPVYINK